MIKRIGGVMKWGLLLSLGLGVFFGGGAGVVRAETYTLDKVQPTSGTIKAETDVFVGGIVNLVFWVAAVLAFAFLIYGAIGWIVASGDKTKLETAQRRMRQAMIGLLVLASVWAIFSLVMQVFFGRADGSISISGGQQSTTQQETTQETDTSGSCEQTEVYTTAEGNQVLAESKHGSYQLILVQGTTYEKYTCTCSGGSCNWVSAGQVTYQEVMEEEKKKCTELKSVNVASGVTVTVKNDGACCSCNASGCSYLGGEAISQCQSEGTMDTGV